MLFRKLSDLILVNKDSIYSLELSKYLINHALDQQFVKQTLIRNNSISILNTSLQIHLCSCIQCSYNSLCSLLNNVIQRIFQQSWNISGKFTFINIFIKSFSTDIIRRIEPKIDLILFQTAQEYSLSTYAVDTFIGLLLHSKNNAEIKFLVDIFQQNSNENFSNIESIKKTICECLLPKLTRENCEKLSDIIVESMKSFNNTDCRANKLILFCVYQLFYVNKQKKIETSKWDFLLNIILNEEFIDRISIDCDESVRMQLFSILCREINRQNSRKISNWILEFLMRNLSISSNKLRHHFLMCFKPVVSVVIVKNIDNRDAISTGFLGDLLKYLISNLYPGASFYKRSSILAFLDLILSSVDCKRIFDLLDVTNEQYSILMKTLIYFFSDTFEENRSSASKCFVAFANMRPQLDYYDSLKRISYEKSCASNPHDCSVAFTIMRTLIQITDYKFSPCEIAGELMERLETDVGNINNNIDLVQKAMNSPFYSSLFCLRQLLHENFEDISCKLPIERVISLCYKINEIIFPFIASAAPEGCLPEEIRSSLDSHLIECHPEYLTICCWRSCKEISLILGHISSASVENYPHGLKQVQEISEFFFVQITSVTHKGAFESLSVGFEKLCQTLWKSQNLELSKIPMNFIEKSISILYLNEDLCATRRSAGLPHLFLILITSEPLINKQRSSLNYVMEHFNSILSKADSQDSADQKRIIHVFNILRLLFKESSLITQLINHTFTSIKYSVQFFTSNMWPLRNSATLLYCALIERIFGPNKSVKFHNKFNRMNSKIFFNRYQHMYEFIVNYCDECDKMPLNLDTSTKIYPILIILARLIPEPDDFQNSYDLKEIKQQVKRYLNSPVWIIRVSAAKAIAALTQGDVSSSKTIENLTEQIIDSPRNHNFIHGTIKTIRCILEDLLDNSFISENQSILFQNIVSNLWCQLSSLILNLSDSSQCPNEFMELFAFIQKKFPQFFVNIEFHFNFPRICFPWQIKLLVFVSNNNFENKLKYLAIDTLQASDYNLRKEMLKQLIETPNLSKHVFDNFDFLKCFAIMCSECHPSVDYLWIKLIDQLISAKKISEDSLILVLNYAFKIVKENHCSKVRTKKFCVILELIGNIFKTFPLENELFDEYLKIIKSHCPYENDLDIRISCGKSMRNLLENNRLNFNDIVRSKILEICLIQLNDEEINIRNQATTSVANFLQMNQIKFILPSVVNSRILKPLIREESIFAQLLSNNSPIGYNYRDALIEKNSVFDSEEINFYYDFLEVHSVLKLNMNRSITYMLECSLDQILKESLKFSHSYQMKLLDK